jgi:hypothetical protein
MFEFLVLFTIFNALVGLAALQRAFKLSTPQGRARWASARLYGIAVLVAWTLPILCIAATLGAWYLWTAAAGHHAGPVMAAPVGWLLVWGLLFAIVDIAEDGIWGNWRKDP